MAASARGASPIRLSAFWLVPLTVLGIAVGSGFWLGGRRDLADLVWTVPTVIVAVRLAWSIVRDLLDGKAGVDIIALLAISGALLLGETFAAAVIAAMSPPATPSSATPKGVPIASFRRSSAGHRRRSAATVAAPSRSPRSLPSSPVIGCSFGRAKSSPSTASSAAPMPSSTSRR